MKEFTKNSILLLCAVCVSLAALEGLSRLAWPIQYGHKSFTLDGTPLDPAPDLLDVLPAITYRQKAQEFDKITTHTARGFRGPAGDFMDAPEPAALFLGDSMTYGVGLGDDETIPFLYCRTTGTPCANLGRPGTGTLQAADILENRLTKDGWRPLHVHLLMNVMTAAQFGGNDLSDNMAYVPPSQAPAPAAPQAIAGTAPAAVPAMPPLAFTHEAILARSNLARVAYYILAPMLRRWFSPGMAENDLTRSLDATRLALERLDSLSKRYGFAYTIWLVHPMQDLMRGTWTQTRDHISAIAPGRVVDTAPALLDRADPASYYYPLDGHVRPEGAARIAAFMAEND